jgi:hypothetical protein
VCEEVTTLLVLPQLETERSVMKKVFFLLGELVDEDIDWMISTGRREEVTAGTVLIQEGRPIDTCSRAPCLFLSLP